MNAPLPPTHDTFNLDVPMSAPQLVRRSSRSSSSQRSSRVEKPRSNHNSPRVIERRKTTSGTKRYATLDDHYNMMFGIKPEEQENESSKESSRPMSWHPASAQFHVPSRSSVIVDQSSPQDWTHQTSASRNSAHGSEFYSLSARGSMYPEQMQSFDNAHHEENRGSRSSDSSWQSVSQPLPYTLSAYSTPATETMPWYLNEWAQKTQTQTTISQHGSTDFLPIQHPSTDYDNDDDVDMDEDTGKDLVGMGLYDMPESSLEWGFTESTGKGLKLEETWQPPPSDDEDEDNDNDDEDDASSDEGSLDEPTAVVEREAHRPQVNVVKPQVPAKTNMDGQSFFFDEDESYTKEWWFQQLKQPSAPVRETGLGYGWL